MAKLLDFNSFEQPTLPIIMKDESRTQLNVTAPSEALIEKLDANRDEISKRLRNVENAKTFRDLLPMYDFAAELISNNKEGIEMNGTDLRYKYNVNYLMLFAFFVAYMEFINEIKLSKN